MLMGCVARATSPEREHHAQAMVNKGAALIHLGRFQEAQAAFRVAAESAQIAGAYDGLACVQFLTGDMKGAEKLFRQTIEWFPEYLPAQGNLALLLDIQGRKREAESYYRGAIAGDPMNYKVRNNYGILLRDRKMPHVSDTFLQDAYAISGDPLVKANIERKEVYEKY